MFCWHTLDNKFRLKQTWLKIKSNLLAYLLQTILNIHTHLDSTHWNATSCMETSRKYSDTVLIVFTKNVLHNNFLYKIPSNSDVFSLCLILLHCAFTISCSYIYTRLPLNMYNRYVQIKYHISSTWLNWLFILFGMYWLQVSDVLQYICKFCCAHLYKLQWVTKATNAHLIKCQLWKHF